MKKYLPTILAVAGALLYSHFAAASGGADIGLGALVFAIGATNYVQEGDVLDLVAPYNVAAGAGAQVGSIFGVSLQTLLSGATGPFARCGVFDLTALSTATGAQGAKVYWDNVNKRCDTDSTVGMLIGALSVAKTSGQTTARVVLNESVPGEAEGPQGTIADLTDSSGGAVANGTIEVVTAPTALTDNSGGTANATLEACGTAVTGVDGAGSNAASKADVDTRLAAIANNFADLAARQAENRAAIVALTNAVTELAAKQNAVLATMRTLGLIAAA